MEDDNHDRSAIVGGGGSRPDKVAPGGFSLLLLLFYAMGVGMVARIVRVLGRAMQSVGVR
jgi:hypothetical protein